MTSNGLAVVDEYSEKTRAALLLYRIDQMNAASEVSDPTMQQMLATFFDRLDVHPRLRD